MTPSQVSFYLKRFQAWNLKVIHDTHHISDIICIGEAHIFSHPWLPFHHQPGIPEMDLPVHPTCLLVYFWAKPSSFCHLPRDLTAGGQAGEPLEWRVDGMIEMTQKDIQIWLLISTFNPNRMWFLTNKNRRIYGYMWIFAWLGFFFENSQVKY